MRALLAALTILVSITAAHAETLRIGYQKIGVLVVLKQQQRLEKALGPKGIDVKWSEFQTGPSMMEALNAGAIDLGYTGDSPPVFAQAGGVDLLYVGVQPLSGVQEGIVVHRDSPIHSVADLKGKRVAFARGSSAHYAIVRILATAGLKPADIHAVFLPPADARAAFRNGSVDAWVIWDPFFAVAEQDPDGRVLTGGLAAPSASFILGRRGFVTAHPDLTAEFLREINDAAVWCGAHQDELAEVMSAVTRVEVAAQRVAAARGAYHFSVLTEDDIVRQQDVADTFFALKAIPTHVDVRSATWAPPAELVAKESGIKESRP
jgi:aliphatic sulfonates family ABC transporter substrate-binding protein